MLAAWLHCLAKVPTAFHLWCAERELRRVDARQLSPALRRARTRHLELLRGYRRRGEFPLNSHAPSRLAPCFVDTGGRQCAVAYLMIQGGAGVAAEKIKCEANHARISAMRFAEFDDWASRSGLSKDELARIQPQYVPTPDEALRYAQIILAFWFVGALALNSIMFNVGRLLWAHRPRVTTAATGILLGAILLYLSVQTDSARFIHSWPLHREILNARMVGLVIGIAAIVCGIAPLGDPRKKWRPELTNSELHVPCNGHFVSDDAPKLAGTPPATGRQAEYREAITRREDNIRKPRR
jgi:hypothetical protein